MHVLPHMRISAHTHMGHPIRVYSYGTPIRVWDNILSHISMSYSQLASRLHILFCMLYFFTCRFIQLQLLFELLLLLLLLLLFDNSMHTHMGYKYGTIPYTYSVAAVPSSQSIYSYETIPYAYGTIPYAYGTIPYAYTHSVAAAAHAAAIKYTHMGLSHMSILQLLGSSSY